jgi:putative membrane protein
MNKRLLPIYLSALILIFFTFVYIYIKNYEFLVYILTIGIFVWVIAKTDKFFNYSYVAKYGFAIWAFLHMAGGVFYYHGTRFYDLILLDIAGAPYHVLRYDQFIHLYCYIILTLFVWAFVTKYLQKDSHKLAVSLTVFLASIGIGAINEIIEFLVVVFFSSGVGDYYNNALDLVFNAAGAIISVLYMSLKK